MELKEYRKDWFNVADPYIVGTETLYYRLVFLPNIKPFNFAMPISELDEAKTSAAIELSELLSLSDSKLNQIAEDINIIDYSLGKNPDEVYLLVRVDNFVAFLAENQTENVVKERVIYDFTSKMPKLITLLEKMAKSSEKNKRRYTDFSFKSLARDMTTLFYKYRRKGEFYKTETFGMTMRLRLKEDYSVLDFVILGKEETAIPTKYSVLKDTRVCSVLYHIDNILAEFSEEAVFNYEKEDDFIDKYVKPRPEVSFTSNFGATDKLIDLILGDSSLLNGKYKPTRDEYKEGFKQQLFDEIRNESESTNDPILDELLSNFDADLTIDGIYEEVLNRIPIESLIALALKCLAKLIPADELRKAICSKIVRTISKSEMTLIIDFLETVGDEIHTTLSKEISQLNLDENSEALLQYTIDNPDSETLICLAVFAVIPAAVYLLSQLLEDQNAIKDKIKEDYHLVKKAVEKRIDYFFDDSLEVFDILSAVRDGLLEAAEAFIAQTFLLTVQKILQSIDQACDTREADIANSSVSPIGQLNINDLLRKTEKNRNTQPAFTDPNLKAYLDELSAILSLTEMCLLLNGMFKDQILDTVMSLLNRPQHSELRKVLDLQKLKQLFEEIGKHIDKSYCEDALAAHEQRKKILIEICTDTTQLKKDLYDQFYGGSFSPDDILRQIQMESDLNKARLENLIDAMRPQDFMPVRNCVDSRHKSEEFLSNTVVRENIKAIGKQFEQNAGGFKQIFLSNGNYLGSLEVAISSGTLPSKSAKAAPELVGYLNDRTKVEAFGKVDNAIITLTDGFYSALPERTTLSMGNRTVTKEKKIFEEFADEILSKNNLNQFILLTNPTKYFDKVVETVVESLLKKVADNNPLLETPQKLRDYPIVSWEKPSGGDCVGPLFSVEEITAIHKRIWEVYCKSGQPEPDKLAMQKIAYDILLYVICLQHCLKAIFALAVFELGEIDNPNSFIVSKITEEVKSSFGLDENSIFATNYKQLVAAQYEEDNFDINFAAEVAEYSRMAFSKIVERSQKEKFFETFGQKDALSSLRSLAAYNNAPKAPGMYRQQYFRMTPNINVEATLTPELLEIYNDLRTFLLYRIETGADTFGLDVLFMPGAFRLAGNNLMKDFDKIIPELSLDYTQFPKNLKDLGYLSAYDCRNVVYIGNAVGNITTSLKNYLETRGKPADDSKFFEFCDEFNKFLSNISNFKKYNVYGTAQLRKVLLTILDKPITDFFTEFRNGERLTVIVRQDDLLSSLNNIEEVTEKVGNIVPQRVQLQLMNYEKDVADITTVRDLLFNGFPTYKLPDMSTSQKETDEAKRVASAIDLDFIEDIAVYMTYAGVEQIYGKRVDDLFRPTRKLARTNVEALSRITNYDQSTDTAASTSLTPSMNFDVFDVVFGAFLKAGANMTDPTWKTTIPGPLTPIGWAAKLYDSDQPENGEKMGPPSKKEVCSDN